MKHLGNTLIILLILTLSLSLPACKKRTGSNASGKKIINLSMPSDIKGFDPLSAGDLYTHVALVQVYEGLLEYEYLKRPYELRPLLAEAMPTVSENSLTYTFKIREGVQFQDDPVFEGKPRFLKASDIVYNFKRLADPSIKHQNWWLFQDRIKGLDEIRESWKKEKSPIDYTKFNVEGLQAPDDRTLVITLKKPFRQFLYVLAMAGTLIAAPEAIAKYGDNLINNPVGTGPFRLKRWVRNQRLDFEKNPRYWGSTYPTEGEDGDKEKGLLADAGKTLPFVDGLTLWIYVESQTAWLNMLKGNLDFTGIPKDAYGDVVDKEGNLKKEYVDRGLILSKDPGADLVFFVFNMKDPILGKNKYLRQAISQAISRKDKIEIFYNNRAIESHGPLPPGIFGYRPELRNPNHYNLDKAKVTIKKALALHKKQTGKDKFPPILQDIYTSSVARQFAEAIDYDLKQIGLSNEIRVGTWTQFSQRMAKSQGQFYSYAWNADYPDPENFLQLLYSKNASPGPNHANFNHKEYDRLFDQMKNMEDGPQRQAIIDKMVKIIHEECPWVLNNHRIAVSVKHPWLRNQKRHAIFPGNYKYLDIDLSKKR